MVWELVDVVGPEKKRCRAQVAIEKADDLGTFG